MIIDKILRTFQSSIQIHAFLGKNERIAGRVLDKESGVQVDIFTYEEIPLEEHEDWMEKETFQRRQASRVRKLVQVGRSPSDPINSAAQPPNLVTFQIITLSQQQLLSFI